MKKITLLLLILLLTITTVSTLNGDAFFTIPDRFYAFGPSIGYSFSDNLAGWTIGFEYVRGEALFTWSIGSRYIFSKDDGFDFSGNNGLLSFYVEGTTALPFPLGIGVSYNMLINGDSGFGVHCYWALPLPVFKKGYLSIFYRPSWVWLGGNPEVIHEIGLYFKYSNLKDAFKKMQQKLYKQRREFLNKQNNKPKNAR